ncbi:hypothetical protein N7494_005122, partial [Penicillium frequentans]
PSDFWSPLGIPNCIRHFPSQTLSAISGINRRHWLRRGRRLLSFYSQTNRSLPHRIPFSWQSRTIYHSKWAQTKLCVRMFESQLNESFKRRETSGQFVFRDQTRYDLSPTLSILGCTLFSRIAQTQMEGVIYGLNDFYHINWSSISHLETSCKIVVLTHYCPLISENVVGPKHRHCKISSGFISDLSGELCCKQEVVKLWAFGHTHFSCDLRDAETGKRVVSNQRGYYSSDRGV